MPRTRIVLFIISSLLFANVNAQILFEETSVSNGLTFKYQEALKMGGGAASFDFDNDGDEDIYIVGGENPDGLFENDGTGNFTDISVSTNIASLTADLMTTSVVTGDIDNDGIREIFIGTIGDIGTAFDAIKSNILLKYNPSTSQYENITQSAEIEDESFCMGAHFFDSNLDGYLDLYLINYVSVPKLIQEGSVVTGFDHECFENKLYINAGNNTFIDQTAFYGLDQIGCSLAATSADLDLDGDDDIIVANDFGKWLEPNQLFQNEGADLPYTDVSESSNANAQMYGMGIAVGDFDEDLDLDFYVTNIGENRLFENMGDMNFQDIAEELNVQNTETENGLNTTGWGAIFEDFNNDTYLDLFVSNGYVYSVVDVDDPIQNDELYLGNSTYTFDNASVESGIEFYGPSRGALKGDWNLDGQMDIITITNENLNPNNQNSINYHNNIYSSNNWIGFDLKGTTSNADAYGAKVVLYSEDRSFLRVVKGGDSHASQGSSKIHFGLGDMQAIDSITIHWPSGQKETLQNLDINKYHNIKEGISTIINESNHLLTGVSIYPNPSYSFFYIETSSTSLTPFLVRLFDSKGLLILEDKLYHSKQKIETSEFATGLYRLVIYADSKTISKNISIFNP